MSAFVVEDQERQREMNKNDRWKVPKMVLGGVQSVRTAFSQHKNKLPWRAEPLVAWVTPALELQKLVPSAELTNIWIRITCGLSQTSGS